MAKINALDARLLFKNKMFLTFGLHREPIKIQCNHCGKITLSDMEWVCGYCDAQNTSTNLYSFLNKCHQCKQPPKCFECPHCGKIVFLVNSRDSRHCARKIGPLETPETEADIRARKVRQRDDAKIELEHEILMVRLNGELPGHVGKKNSPSFSANLEKGIFHCFGCGAKGNTLEFAALMENVNPSDGAALRTVALKLKEKFCPNLGRKVEGKKATVAKTPPSKPKDVPVVVNPPLDFELKGVDRDHPYLKERGFTQGTINHFGIGYCSRGIFKERIVIPLHDHEGNLVGYCGRVIDDAAISEDNPRYRFPSKRERDGHVVEFRKQAFLYNGFRITAPVDDLVVVEGFTAVWWLHQNGIPKVAAVMGADCSEQQAELIAALVKPSGRVWLMPDGNQAGQRCALSLLTLVSPHRFVRWVKLEGDTQPTDLSAAQLKSRLKM